MKLSIKILSVFLYCYSSMLFTMGSLDDAHEKKKSLHYAIRKDDQTNNTLVIHSNKKTKVISFEAPITALTALKTLPYVLIGLQNGSVILHNIQKKKLSTVLPQVHSVKITTLYADENNFFSADAAGINYFWHNIWTNKIYGQKIRTRFPVIDCHANQDYFVLQQEKRRINDPKINILNRDLLRQGISSGKTLHGFFEGFADNNSFLIKQGTRVYTVTISHHLPHPHLQ